jgi:kynurenine aminotransferase
MLKKIENGVVSDQDDEWDINFEEFEKAINEKTKIVLINSPHNPVGKVFTYEELQKIADILQKHPQVIVIEDNVYEGVMFDDMFKKPIPKIAFLKGFRERTVSIYSAGKIFACTGMRNGWIVGPADLIKACRSVHQYNVFCPYNVVETAARQSLV